ncbi:MAG TPA: hypothetical protein VFQ12_03740 [Thermoleophilaceae bacterium]|nr:hypothetical protein [Thermoleophilaceae bacterium]
MPAEEHIVELVQRALGREGIDDELIAAGQFFPRGHTGGAFVGGLLGSEVGGGLAGSVATAGGALAGMHAADAASTLPERMLVGVSATTVYGFDTHREHEREPTTLIFRLERDGLDVRVHQRVNVRVLELIDEASGSAVELEGSRVPTLHAGEVIKALAG